MSAYPPHNLESHLTPRKPSCDYFRNLNLWGRVEQPVARSAHTQEVAGSNPTHVTDLVPLGKALYTTSLTLVEMNDSPVVVRMDEATRSDLMRAQIAAFERHMEQLQSTFSTGTLYKMLKLLTKKQTIELHSLASLAQVSTLLDWEQQRLSDTGGKPKDRDMVHYFSWFLEYVEYLQELKQSFDERIFAPLCQYFYDEEDPDVKGIHSNLEEGEVLEPSKTQAMLLTKTDSVDSGVETGLLEHSGSDYSLSAFIRSPGARAGPRLGSTLEILRKDFPDLLEQYDNKELRQVALQLTRLRRRWNTLFQKDVEIEEDMLDRESGAEVNLFRDSTHFQPVLRLVPDVFIKARKAAGLARRWLEIDGTTSRTLQTKLEQIEEIQAVLERKLGYVIHSIKRKEEKLQRGSEQVQMLLKREDRSNELTFQLYGVDKTIGSLQRRLRELQVEKDYVRKHLRKRADKESEEYQTYRLKYIQTRLQSKVVDRELSTKQYQRTILEEDMHVELECKPSLIRFADKRHRARLGTQLQKSRVRVLTCRRFCALEKGNLHDFPDFTQEQEKCEKLEQELERDRAEKRKIEVALVPLKSERTRLKSEADQQKLNSFPQEQRRRVLRFRETESDDIKVYTQRVRETQQDEIQRERDRLAHIGRQTGRASGRYSFGEAAVADLRNRFFLTDGYDSETDSFLY
ncbi:hypothetical protein Bbelb_240330 [Branchiostoma belcheri]|nr:hypothetical protein Bbelb_240330 [Branchiostoma belcheri]